jgi:DNA sulfur modification protein DndD
MLITKIEAKNFKTYKSLELDLNVSDEKPIILIGGVNNGGKTTLFDAIYFALYGIVIKDTEHFKRLLNASVALEKDTKIELAIDFKGKVLSSEYYYKIKRTYALNTQNQPVESVSLNFNGDTFTYGTSTPLAERMKSEAEVNKIIKANLPKELSKYFLFDAMESGNLLKEDYLSRVIKENIENVMGFNKYMQLGDATTKLKEKYISESIEVESEKEEYTKLLNKKTEIEKQISDLKEKQQLKLGHSIEKKELYRKAKDGKNLQQDYKEQIHYLETKINDLKNKETEYLNSADKFINEIEIQSFLPKLIDEIQDEIELILSKTSTVNNGDKFTSAQLEYISKQVILFLKENNHFHVIDDNVEEIIKKYISNKEFNKENNDEYDFLSEDEILTLKNLINFSSINNFNLIHQNKLGYENELIKLPSLQKELLEARNHLTEDDNSLIENYEKNESELKETKEAISNLEHEIIRIAKELSRYDITEEETPNPKLELLKKIEPLFDIISNKLLITKKQSIEQTMLEDLNTTLPAYAGQIEKVELSEKLSDLSFKIFHKAGNEIYLEELNAASKQIIVQVLLKALHQFGDYNPPVMIDTVMGYLSEDSRSALLEHYFPKLSHQTILFSTDTEIRKEVDLPKIEEFISKKITLIRDKENQLTNVVEGYFNI